MSAGPSAGHLQAEEQPVRMDLTTPRLTLRPIEAANLDALLAIEQDARYAFFARSSAVTREQLARWLVHPPAVWVETPTFAVWLQDQVLGHVVLEISRDDAMRMLGYGIARPWWGQGVATEAASAVLEYAFVVRDLAKVWARLDPRNGASARVLAKLGFQQEGLLRSHVVRRGERCDRALYGLLREEWLQTIGTPSRGATQVQGDGR